MISYVAVEWGFWVLLLTLVISYIGWSKLRIRFLRQELYGVRERLWEQASEFHAFDDVGYRDVRDQLHVLIAIAHKINLPMIIYTRLLIEDSSKEDSLLHTACVDSEMQAHCSQAMSEAGMIVTRYVTRQRFFSGFMLIALIRFAMWGVAFSRSASIRISKLRTALKAGSNVELRSAEFVRFLPLRSIRHLSSI